MTGPRSTRNAEIDEERWRRLEDLRRKSRADLLALPALQEEQVETLGKPVTFTTYVESHDDGRTLVLVRSDVPWLLGMGSYGATDGFWMHKSGDIAEATDAEVMDFFS